MEYVGAIFYLHPQPGSIMHEIEIEISRVYEPEKKQVWKLSLKEDKGVYLLKLALVEPYIGFDAEVAGFRKEDAVAYLSKKIQDLLRSQLINSSDRLDTLKEMLQMAMV